MKTKIALLIFLSLPLSLYSSNITENSGTAGFVFLKMPVGVRAQGMGENFTAVGDASSALFYNPSGLIKVNTTEISAEHILWFEGISKSNLNFVYPSTKIGPVGASINYISALYEKRTSENDENYQSASIWMGALQIGWARKIREDISVGCGLKYIKENLDVSEVSGLALDIGGLYELEKKTTIGLSIQNLGIQLTDKNPDTLPSLVRIGAARKIAEDKLLIASDFVYGFVDGTTSIGIGGEYSPSKYFCPRIGYKYLFTNNNLSPVAGLNVGFGIRYREVGFDYSFSPRDTLGLVHLVSFSVKL